MEVFWSSPHTAHTGQRPIKLKSSTITGRGQSADREMGQGIHTAHEDSVVLTPEASSLDPQEEDAMGIFPKSHSLS